MALVAPSAPKRHGFSIESLIGRRDDSPRRQTSLTNGVLSGFPRPEDFASPARDSASRDGRSGTTKDCQAKDLSLNGRNSGGLGVPEAVQDGRRSGHQSGRRGDSPIAFHHNARDGPLYDRELLFLRGGARHVSGSPPEDKEQPLHRDREGSSSFRDFQKDRLFAREMEFQRDRDLAREMEFQRDRDLARDVRVAKDRASRSPVRPGTASPSSTCTEEERRERASSLSPVPLASSSPRLATFSGDPGPKASPRSPASPEAENRLGGSWSPEDLKHLLHNAAAAAAAAAAAGGPGAFHPGGGGPPSHHHPLLPHHPSSHPSPHGGGGLGSVDSPASHSGLFQPLRMCNRSLSAAMSSLLPPQLAHLPFSPLLYSLQRDLASAAAHNHPHHPAAAAAHPLLARYPGFMHPRYPLGPPHPGLLFHPYRKPKRNRTAFSPNQLLQLEQAFEKNHYVVGQERKTLASKLQLTETQVKVWFQNRRTKHKRMKAEEEQGTGGVTSGDEAGKSGDHSDGEHMDNKSDVMSDHELLAGEEDDVCLTDDEEELSVTEDS